VYNDRHNVPLPQVGCFVLSYSTVAARPDKDGCNVGPASMQ